MTTLKQMLEQLQSLQFGGHNQDFLLTWEKSAEDLRALTLIAEALCELHRAGKPFRVFETGLAISIFRDQSTRTRFSYASAASLLGLQLSELDESAKIASGKQGHNNARLPIKFLDIVELDNIGVLERLQPF